MSSYWSEVVTVLAWKKKKKKKKYSAEGNADSLSTNYLVLLGVILNMLFVHTLIDSESNHFIKIPFINKGIEFID